MAVNVPADFPRDPPPGAVPGAQPKLLARRVGDKYVAALTDEEVAERFRICEDLVRQLLPYCHSKHLARPDWSTEVVLRKTFIGIRSKRWDFSDAEIAWTLRQVAQWLHWAPYNDQAG